MYFFPNFLIKVQKSMKQLARISHCHLIPQVESRSILSERALRTGTEGRGNFIGECLRTWKMKSRKNKNTYIYLYIYIFE